MKNFWQPNEFAFHTDLQKLVNKDNPIELEDSEIAFNGVS
uniref:Uncharacterized protein n=1 Tax=Tetranychus urticae TaxID=32264 RepID=T1KQK6_TETUR